MRSFDASGRVESVAGIHPGLAVCFRGQFCYSLVAEDVTEAKDEIEGRIAGEGIW